MPSSLPSLCLAPGCTSRVPRGYCPQHRPKDERPNASRRGYGAQHRKWRELILNRDPLCVRCLPRIVPATVADHIIPIRDGGERFALSNGQGLCARCHAQKTAEDLRAS